MHRTPRILVVDDNATNLTVLARPLEKAGYEVLTANNGFDAVTVAGQEQPDLILLDMMMPDRDGLEVCRILKSQEGTASIPILFVTAQTESDKIIDAFTVGGVDYIPKPFRVDEMLARVCVHVRLLQAERLLAERNEQLEGLAARLEQTNLELARQARRDPLTRLLNRGAWEESARLEDERTDRHGHVFSVVMLDVDHFKALNDELGHQRGDDCLRRIARSISSACRSTDLAGRYGGEEFVVLAPETEEEGANDLAERIRTAVWTADLAHPSSSCADRVTVSAGTASSRVGSLEQVIRVADKALYRAKRTGRNRVCGAREIESPSGADSAFDQPMKAESSAADCAGTVLIVDDEPTSRALCKGVLRRKGYQVHEAGDGDAALIEAERNPPDVILMDVLMPKMDGLECTKRLRSSPRTCDVPIVMVSAHADASDIDAGLDAGADEYLIKPVRARELEVRVRSMTRLHRKHKETLEAKEAGLRESNRDLIAVSGVHPTLFACNTVREVAELLTDTLVRRFGAYFARVWLVGQGDLCSECALSKECRDNKRCLHLTASAGHYAQIDGDHRRVPLGAFKIGLIAEGRGKTVCNDVVNDDRVHDRDWAAKHDLKSFAGFPLVHDGETIGVMALFSKHELPDHLLQTLDLFAKVGTAALKNVSDAEVLRKLSVVVEQSAASIVITDTRGTIEYVNPVCCEISGYTAEELTGQNPRILKSGNKSKKAYKKLWDTILAGSIWTGAFENRKKNGELYWEEASISPIRDGNGAVTHFLAVKQDITERKKVETSLRRTEAELRKHRDNLEEMVSERTAELAKMNDALVHEVEDRCEAERAAAAASRAKGDFLATMSHELRTPLNGVIGMMELLLRSDLSEKQRRHAWLAKSSGDTLLTLINDILDFSKIESGKLELETTDFDLRYTVESLGASLVSRAEGKGLELICSVHPQTPALVQGDPGRLQQILINLTTNAIKFTEHGEVVVRATKDDETHEDVTVRFTVTDTGIGIPSDRRDRLFQSFSQVDSSTTRKYGGTGLGLSISKRLVELMGGEIGVESELGRGSTFWFTVKLKRQVAGNSQTQTLDDDFRYVRILAVDDNPTNREILVEQLNSYGFETDTAGDGEEALAKLRAAAARTTPFGLAILDMQMPGMDGEQLAQAIKTDSTIGNTALMLLTSGGNSEGTDRIRSLGFSGWLTKPVRQSQLFDTIVETLACATAVPSSSRDRARPREDSSRTQVTRKAKTAGSRILLAEDNEISQEVAVEFLIRAGYHCIRVRDGQQAVDVALRGECDLILMDCQMPEMDGFDATRAIRQHEKDERLSGGNKKRILIIALTANAIKGDRERCLEAGMDDYLTKPLDPDRLVEIIENHLTPESETSPAPQAEVPDERPPKATLEEERAAPTPFCASAPFDLHALFKRWGPNKAFAEKLIAKFCLQVPTDLEKLEQSVAAGEVEEATRLAHGLKGAASYVSADAFRAVAARLEEMGRAGDMTDAEACLSELRAEFNRCLENAPRRMGDVDLQHANTDR